VVQDCRYEGGSMITADVEKELKTLKRTIRKFLDEISGVPMRAIDCDQDKVERLWDKLDELCK
jgi:hypothetical protein